MSPEPTWAVLCSGVLLLLVLFGPLVIVEWRAIKEKWREFWLAAQDAFGPLP